MLLQWGRFINSRPGIVDHLRFDDEPPVVEFEDFRYWIRTRPNPGFNLPALGYWSRARGRRRPRRPWE